MKQAGSGELVVLGRGDVVGLVFLVLVLLLGDGNIVGFVVLVVLVLVDVPGGGGGRVVVVVVVVVLGDGEG